MNTDITVLVVEDNDALREMFRRRITRKKYTPVMAADGEEALNLAKELVPDIILLDMNLPGKNGWVIAGELKATVTTRLIPIIAITAHAMLGDRERALEAGCNDYVSKPIDFDALFETMARLLSE